MLLMFAESEVAGVTVSADRVELRFAAARLLRPSPDGGPPVEGYGRGLRLELFGARTADTAGAFGRLADGRLQLGGAWAARVPLPTVFDGPVRLELAFANRTTLVLAGHGFACGFDGVPDFAEALSC